MVWADDGNKTAAQVTLRIQAAKRLASVVPREITGKFAEHLGQNIYNGMDAQILWNPTLADYPWSTGRQSVDGIATFLFDRREIAQALRLRATRQGWPAAEIDRLVEAREDGLACWWTRQGDRDAVQVSPDTGPYGGRAQRVEVRGAGKGIAQWTYLPLHRVRKFEFDIVARAPDVASLTVTLAANNAQGPCTTATVKGLTSEWQTFHGILEVPEQSPADVVYRLSLVTDLPGQFVIARLLLRPADHLSGADPDVVRLLRESRLPLLRWPGGNFVSGYRWEDGVGPAERRPTLPNRAWGGVETNQFGTDEFVAFCRAVGCEPMICINAGDGTPDEAARWVQYCNGPADSPQGARRAANGHPEPYHIHRWEIGNELWGRWQVHWTTASGYADRYLRMAQALRAADPSVTLYACGAPVLWGKDWNDTLIARTAPALSAVTDHPLIGGTVSPDCDPLDVFRDFMAVPQVLEKRWAALRNDMAKAGVRQPRLAVTELQMFAHLGSPSAGGAEPRLRPERLVTPATQAEALYDVLIYHAAVRLSPLIELITHSAVINHGGGLRKEHERVYADPCYYAQAMFAELAGATPVATEVEASDQQAPRVLPELKNVTERESYPVLDALAAATAGGDLLISLVHRGTAGPLRVVAILDGCAAQGPAEIRTLAAGVPWATNSLESPQAVRPVDSTAQIRDGKLVLEIHPYSVVRVRLPKAYARVDHAR